MYKIKNVSGSNLGVGRHTIPAHGSIYVEALDGDLLRAVANGLITEKATDEMSELERLKNKHSLDYSADALAGQNTAGGRNGSIQVNDGGALRGAPGLSYDFERKTLRASGFAVSPDTIVATDATAYELSADDDGKILKFTSDTGVTITTAAGLGSAFSCTILQRGDGQITFAAGDGTTVDAFEAALKTAGKFAMASIFADTEDAFILVGNVVP